MSLMCLAGNSIEWKIRGRPHSARRRDKESESDE